MGGIDNFIRAFGAPDPPAPWGVPEDAHVMLPFYKGKNLGAGWYLDRFFFLFGEGLDRLHQCFTAWSIPPVENRVILGYNAYGAIIALEHGDDAMREMVKVLNPLTRQYFEDRNLTFGSLIASWLPERRIPDFFDTSAYQRHRRADGDLAPFQILGWEGDVFVRQDIIAYYARTRA